MLMEGQKLSHVQPSFPTWPSARIAAVRAEVRLADSRSNSTLESVRR